jgi:hypothetical protein
MFAAIALATTLQSIRPLADLPILNHPQVDALPRRGAFGASFAPKEGEGFAVASVAPGLTAEKMGLKTGDVLISPTNPAGINELVRKTKVGDKFSVTIKRGADQKVLQGTVIEKPRDLGNANYEVVYSHVVNNGQKMRTIITVPRKPGKHPALFFIQGFAPISYDYVLETSTGDVTSLNGPILREFANSNFVTIRVEKPGVGDSEGGPFAQLDYHGEIGIYKEALKQLKAHKSVDPENVFIFGHSMGGSFGPMVAAENKVKGIAVYGVAARTWFEYLLDTIRYQSLVGGVSYEQADTEARLGAKIMALAMLEKKSAEEIKKLHPDLAPIVDSYFPGGLFNQKTLDFWRQLNEINFPSYWVKCDTHVLAVKGESDFVVYDVDHKLIADIVNRAKPGYGTFAIAPDSDHLFHNFDTEPDSLRNFQRGKFNPNFTKMMKDWIMNLISKNQ